MSNGSNLQKEGGSSYKKRDCLALWDDATQRGELPSTSIVSFPAGLHNKKAEHSWRVDIG